MFQKAHRDSHPPTVAAHLFIADVVEKTFQHRGVLRILRGRNISSDVTWKEGWEETQKTEGCQIFEVVSIVPILGLFWMNEPVPGINLVIWAVFLSCFHAVSVKHHSTSRDWKIKSFIGGIKIWCLFETLLMQLETPAWFFLVEGMGLSSFDLRVWEPSVWVTHKDGSWRGNDTIWVFWWRKMDRKYRSTSKK